MWSIWWLHELLEQLLETLRSDNGDGNGNVRSLGRAGLRPVGVPAKIEITNFTSENVDDGHWCQRKVFFKTMPKFRDTILLAHASRLINAEEFVLLYDIH